MGGMCCRDSISFRTCRLMNLKSKKGQMARRIVYFCLGVLFVTTVWAMILKSIDRSVDLSDVLVFVGAWAGGELLLTMLKRIFAKPNTNEEEFFNE